MAKQKPQMSKTFPGKLVFQGSGQRLSENSVSFFVGVVAWCVDVDFWCAKNMCLKIGVAVL